MHRICYESEGRAGTAQVALHSNAAAEPAWSSAAQRTVAQLEDQPKWLQDDLALIYRKPAHNVTVCAALQQVTQALGDIVDAENHAQSALLQSRLHHAQSLRMVFDAVDLDGSGEVSRAEFRRFLAGVERHSPGLATVNEADSIFSSMDKDGSGVLSFVEARTAIYKSGAKQ